MDTQDPSNPGVESPATKTQATDAVQGESPKPAAEEMPAHLVTSPDINHSLMLGYIGKRARLTGSIVEVREENNLVVFRTSDSATVNLTYDADWDLWGSPTPFITAVGKVVDGNTMHLESFINLGANVDLETVEATIRIIHDPRFRAVFFPFNNV
ncbi:hypothetical protein VNI00_016855 [Paramarasmius palmivorus]|uniref:Replication protein A3 n=1 Tax=Paramarasmius palmivorus TaxID=297713 RepID=A0AAW0BB85_9AGAR